MIGSQEDWDYLHFLRHELDAISVSFAHDKVYQSIKHENALAKLVPEGYDWSWRHSMYAPLGSKWFQPSWFEFDPS